MGTKETVSSSKSEKSCSPLQEHPSFNYYPDWASIQGYCGPGVLPPPHYFNATVVPGHVPHPYIWGHQPMIPPFAGPYSVYPHGGIYPHPSTYMTFPMNQEIPAKLSTSKDREAKDSKVSDRRHALSVGNSNAESEECTGNSQSASGTKEEEGSTDGVDCSTDSGGSKIERSRSSDDVPNSDKNAAPTISLEMSAHCATIAGNKLIPVPHNRNQVMDLKASSSGKVNPGGMPLVPTSSAREEREMKREKRKQSNRESARRSRLRKQAETEELAVKVGNLNAENTSLRSEITLLMNSSEKLRLENTTLMEKLRLKQSIQAEDITPGLAIENLLSRIDDSVSDGTGRIDPFESGLPQQSNGKIHQLLDPNSRTDSAIASS